MNKKSWKRYKIGSEPQNCPTAGYFNFQHSVRIIEPDFAVRLELFKGCVIQYGNVTFNPKANCDALGWLFRYIYYRNALDFCIINMYWLKLTQKWRFRYQRPFAYDNVLLCFTSTGTFEPLTFVIKPTMKKTLECLGLENLGLKSQKKISYLDK